MKQENNKKSNKISNNGWIDVHDDALMVELGIRPKPLSPKDPNVWTKTNQERKLLRNLKRSHKEKIHMGSIPEKVIPVKAKLIIQLKRNNKFPNTTYSMICYMHKISNILSSFMQYDKQSKTMINLVAKYKYNDKEYSPNELPFWK
jgi:hypothetical protein